MWSWIKNHHQICRVNQLDQVVGLVKWDWLVQTSHKPNIQTNKLQSSKIDQVARDQLLTNIDLTSTTQHIPPEVPWNTISQACCNCQPSTTGDSHLCPPIVVWWRASILQVDTTWVISRLSHHSSTRNLIYLAVTAHWLVF